MDKYVYTKGQAYTEEEYVPLKAAIQQTTQSFPPTCQFQKQLNFWSSSDFCVQITSFGIAA
jgi:hypothetical protein